MLKGPLKISILTSVPGNGFGLLQPVASEDITPPCVGYFDINGYWNLIANLSADMGDSHPDYSCLAYEPRKVSDVAIEWQPKTSAGVTAVALDTSASTPYALLFLPPFSLFSLAL